MPIIIPSIAQPTPAQIDPISTASVELRPQPDPSPHQSMPSQPLWAILGMHLSLLHLYSSGPHLRPKKKI